MCSVTKTAAEIISRPSSQCFIYQPGCLFDSARTRLWAFFASQELSKDVFLIEGFYYQCRSSPVALKTDKSCVAYDEDADEVWSSAEQQREDQKQVSNKDVSALYFPRSFSLSLFLPPCLFPSFSSPCSLLISLSAFVTPLFIEQVVLLRLSMKLCVCEPAKYSKSHSSVRHSSYTLPSDKSQTVGGSSTAAVSHCSGEIHGEVFDVYPTGRALFFIYGCTFWP